MKPEPITQEPFNRVLLPVPLREALCVVEPEGMFGPRREHWEYREGELVVVPAEAGAEDAGVSGDGRERPPGGAGGPPPVPPGEPAAPLPA